MSGNVVAHRALRWLSLGISVAGLVMSASGVFLLVRSEHASKTAPARVAAPPSSSSLPDATSEPETTNEPDTTTTAPPLHTDWQSCTGDSYQLQYPLGWATPDTGTDACHIFHVVNSGDAGTGYLVVARAPETSLDDLARQLATPPSGFGAFTHSTLTRDGRTLLRASASNTIAPDLPVATVYAVQIGSDTVTVTSFSAGQSNQSEDELAAIAATVEPS